MMKIIRVNTKFIILYLVLIVLSLFYINQISKLLIIIGDNVDYNSLSFQLGYFLMIGLLMLGYTYSLNNRFIQNKQLTFFLFYVTAVYLLLRFLFFNLIYFCTIYESIRYADIIIMICLFHILNLILVELKCSSIKDTTKKPSYFLEDGIYIDGVIENEKILQKLIDAITEFKPDSAFSVGINAVWGYGKTSFLHRFKNEYQRKNLNSIIFWNRIWKNKGSVAIIENFFEELKNNLKPFSAEIAGDINNYVDSILKLSDTDLHKIISSGRTILNENSTLEKFYDGINENIKKIDRQVIILLDDLDRLEKPEVMDTLKLIRTLSDFNNVIFIAGYDRKYIVDTIESPKNNYLDKIFNVEINLLPFDEELITYELIKQVDVSYPQQVNGFDEMDFNKSFKELFKKSEMSLADIEFPNFAQNIFVCSNQKLRYQDFLKTYRDVKRFINEFKFNASFLNSELDVVGKEYILLKLLNYRFRDLNNILFPNLHKLLTPSTIDVENKKINFEKSSFNNIYVYDAEAQNRINELLNDYSQTDIDIINSVLCNLFSSKSLSFYQNNQHSISKIYYTEVYIRNNIAGAKFSLSDFQAAFSSASLSEMVNEIESSTNSKFQVSNELKQFIFNNESQSKVQFLDILKTLNILIGYGTLIDDQKIIDILNFGFDNYYFEDNKAFLLDLSEILNNGSLGYLDKLLSEISKNLKRKESGLNYGGQIKGFEKNNLSITDIKHLYLEKIKVLIKNQINPDNILAVYNLYIEAIVGDKHIVFDKDFNELVRKDITDRFLDYFNSSLFESLWKKNDDQSRIYNSFEPIFTIAQIFSNPKTQELVIQNPQDLNLHQKFYTEGWNQFNSFINDENLMKIEDISIRKKIEFMKRFVNTYIENGYMPLNKSQYDEIWEELPF